MTLEQDLSRRDLTINSIAVQAINTPAICQFELFFEANTPILLDRTQLIDPYGGLRDLDAKVLRHVSPAFAEDPVRILRLARFAARFSDFTVAPETMALMRQMVQNGEVDALFQNAFGKNRHGADVRQTFPYV